MLTLCLALCGCGSSGETDSKLYGTWINQSAYLGSMRELEFKENGTVYTDFGDGNKAYKYSTSGDTLTINMTYTKNGAIDLRFQYLFGTLTDDPTQEVLVLRPRNLDGTTDADIVFIKK